MFAMGCLLSAAAPRRRCRFFVPVVQLGSTPEYDRFPFNLLEGLFVQIPEPSGNCYRQARRLQVRILPGTFERKPEVEAYRHPFRRLGVKSAHRLWPEDEVRSLKLSLY